VSPAALALAAALAAGPALPEGAARYRMELAGEHVGAAELTIRCDGGRCAATWSIDLVLPEEAGGERTGRRVEVDVDVRGRQRDGLVPAMIAPLVLLSGGARCVAAVDEETGERGQACRTGRGAVNVMGVAMEVARGRDGFPAEVAVPSQRMRFVRAPGAAAPADAPRLFGTRVAGPAGARRFCGAPRDGPASAAPAGLPAPRGEGASCRAITVDWLARAERAGHPGRVAVGVVWTGRGWAWHAWAEVPGPAAAWASVDPTFGESPARAPRFTVARWTPGDEASRLAAGKRVLACWGERAR